MKCPNCNSKIRYRDSVQQSDGTDAYRCTNCDRVSKAKHGLPFFILVFAIIVALGDLVFSGILESLVGGIGGQEALNDKTIRIIALAISAIVYFAVFRMLNKLEFVEEKNSDETEST